MILQRGLSCPAMPRGNLYTEHTRKKENPSSSRTTAGAPSCPLFKHQCRLKCIKRIKYENTLGQHNPCIQDLFICMYV